MKEYEKVFSFRLYERITICVEKILLKTVYKFFSTGKNKVVWK